MQDQTNTQGGKKRGRPKGSKNRIGSKNPTPPSECIHKRRGRPPVAGPSGTSASATATTSQSHPWLEATAIARSKRKEKKKGKQIVGVGVYQQCD